MKKNEYMINVEKNSMKWVNTKMSAKTKIKSAQKYVQNKN